MKIYTKTGDKGITSLYGGKKVSKDHIRIDAYGTVDELNSVIGLIRSQQPDSETDSFLIEIQKSLFTLGAELATPNEKFYLQNGKPRLSELIESTHIKMLEVEIDRMEISLMPLMHFILPGGLTIIANCHLARTVCRRAERITVALNNIESIRTETIAYLNRLSDYFFVLARYQSHLNHYEETKWIPNG